jgi:thiaminase
VIQALQKELRLFEERGAAVGIDLRAAPPSFTCDAYVQFLMATAYQRSYAEGYTVLYAAEKAYHDSWKVVQAGLDESSPWYPFVENWAGEEFAGYVSYLEGELNRLAEEAGPGERARMAELFERTTKYEIAFWEMALTGGGWPGTTAAPTRPADAASSAPGAA